MLPYNLYYCLDPRYCCVLLNLAVFLEKWLRDGAGTISQWLLLADGITDQTSSEASQDKETERCQLLYAKTLKNILEDSSVFEKSPLAGKLGTCSIQKSTLQLLQESLVFQKTT